MKSSTLLIAVCTLVIATTTLCRGQDQGFFAIEGGFKPTFSLSESWTETLVIVHDPFDSTITFPVTLTTLTTSA
ncbi:MAG: hypothetical protein U0984_11575, partial [Prosthecobacter sp.]|nr:hypothetical protein [Prosthecobacter sp.]